MSGDFAIVLLNDAVARAQAKASSLPDGLGGVERLENMFGFLEAAAGIRELDTHLSSGRTDGDIKSATAHLFQCINGIGDELQEDMEKLAGIAANERGGALLMEIDANVRQLGNAAEMQGAIDEGFDIERDDLQRGFLGEPQHVLNQGIGALRVLIDF